MFSYISGQITDKTDSSVTIEANGVGYEMFASAYTISDCVLGQSRRLYAYLQVKEDGVALFGFSSKEEKNMFLLLTSVSGVGCKVAQSVLSGMDYKTLAGAIFGGDTKQLTKIKGLGKKTAERIVLELREKVIPDENYIGAGQQSLNFDTPVQSGFDASARAAISVLCSLGKNQSDAEKLVEAAIKLGATSTEEIVNMAFRID